MEVLDLLYNIFHRIAYDFCSFGDGVVLRVFASSIHLLDYKFDFSWCLVVGFSLSKRCDVMFLLGANSFNQ